jgi:hypothetical protein
MSSIKIPKIQKFLQNFCNENRLIWTLTRPVWSDIMFWIKSGKENKIFKFSPKCSFGFRNLKKLPIRRYITALFLRTKTYKSNCYIWRRQFGSILTMAKKGAYKNIKKRFLFFQAITDGAVLLRFPPCLFRLQSHESSIWFPRRKKPLLTTLLSH